MIPDDPADRHRHVAAAFATVAREVQDWDAPTPVAAWRARDVVDHLVGWLPGVLEPATGIVLAAPSSDDPAAAWDERCVAVQAVLDDPVRAGAPTADARFPGTTTAGLIDLLYTSDVFLHRWDLARSAGVPADLDPDHAAAMLAGMQEVEGQLRSSGHYGPAVPVAADAPVEDRLVAFIGRDPAWRRR